MTLWHIFLRYQFSIFNFLLYILTCVTHQPSIIIYYVRFCSSTHSILSCFHFLYLRSQAFWNQNQKRCGGRVWLTIMALKQKEQEWRSTNDEPLTRSYDSDISILKIRQRLAGHPESRNCLFNWNKVKLSVSIDSLVLILRDKVWNIPWTCCFTDCILWRQARPFHWNCLRV